MDWSKLRVWVDVCGWVRCEAGWSLKRGWGDRLKDYDLWMVWAGRGHMELVDREIELRPGVAFWMRPGRVYHAQQDPDQRLGVTFIHFNLLDGDGSVIFPDPPPPEVLHCEDVHFTDAVARRVVDLQRLHRHDMAAHWLRMLLMDLDRTHQREDSPHRGADSEHVEMVMRVARDIESQPADVPLVRELAKQAGYSPDHFARVFQNVLGQSPQQYIITARLQHAQRLLRESTMPITRIAEALGYTDAFIFSAQFKRHLGVSPRKFRM